MYICSAATYIICQLLSDYRLTSKSHLSMVIQLITGVKCTGGSYQYCTHTVNHWGLSAQGALTNTVLIQ